MTDEDRLTDLLEWREECFEWGEDVPAEELCRDCPDLAPALAARIQSSRRCARC
jgi:hypothetical protein